MALFRRDPGSSEDEATETNQGSGADYEAMMAEARADNRAIEIPDDAPDAVRLQAEVATILVELVRDQAGDADAHLFAEHANDVIGRREAGKLGFAPVSATKEVADRVVDAMGKVLSSPDATKVAIGSSREDAKSHSGWTSEQVIDGLGVIVALGQRGRKDDLADRSAGDARGVIRAMDERLASRSTGDETVTMSLGVLDTAVEVHGRHMNDHGTKVTTYDFSVIQLGEKAA